MAFICCHTVSVLLVTREMGTNDRTPIENVHSYFDGKCLHAVVFLSSKVHLGNVSVKCTL